MRRKEKIVERIARGQEPRGLTREDNLPEDFRNEAEARFKHKGYIRREQKQLAWQSLLEKQAMPADIDYKKMSGVSREARGKLVKTKPKTLGQAARIPGVTPADISILTVWLKKKTDERNSCFT